MARSKPSRKSSRKKSASSTRSARRKTGRKPSPRAAEKRKTARRRTRKTSAPASPKSPRRTPKKPSFATAESMGQAQKSISVSEFFAKNRHLLGFDNPRKALLTAVKEAVDNSLDACEEAGIQPQVDIRIEQLDETHFKIIVSDNGPGIVRSQIPSIFGRLLYGSKFHRLRMSRGQQGIGISAAGMYGLLTTGRPVRITSRTSPRCPAHYYELQIDTKKNRPDIIREENVEWDAPHGTRVEIELHARYQRGHQSVDRYLEQTVIANPHVTITYQTPDGRTEEYRAGVDHLPPTPREVRPHPYGIELGVLIKMLQDTRARTLTQFLTDEFSRVSPRVAGQILEKARLPARTSPRRVNGEAAKGIYQAIQETQIRAPATDSVVPIGQENLIVGLKRVVQAEFYAASSRRPAVYRGNPFIIEAALAYGKLQGEKNGAAEAGQNDGEDDGDDGELARVIRFANRVPLQYQRGACAITKSVTGTNWRQYGISQSRGALPAGPLTIVVHMASVWVPFTSESKEAVASYPEITKEIRLALQECGRKLARHVRRTARVRQEMKKRSYIQRYIPAIGEALRDILDLKQREVERTCADLRDVLERSRKL